MLEPKFKVQETPDLFYFANAKGLLPVGMASPFINCFSLLSQTGSIPSGGTGRMGDKVILYHLFSFMLEPKFKVQESICLK